VVPFCMMSTLNKTNRTRSQVSRPPEPEGDAKDHQLSKNLVSLRTISTAVDADRATVSRWLRQAGVEAYVLGRGPRAAIRYDLDAVTQWLRTRQPILTDDSKEGGR
jgi:hypothetical protein